MQVYYYEIETIFHYFLDVLSSLCRLLKTDKIIQYIKHIFGIYMT